MQLHRVPTNMQKHRNYISFMDMHILCTTLILGKHVTQTSQSNFDDKVILRYLF